MLRNQVRTPTAHRLHKPNTDNYNSTHYNDDQCRKPLLSLLTIPSQKPKTPQILGGIADTVAQSLTAFRHQRPKHRSLPSNTQDTELVPINLDNEKGKWQTYDHLLPKKNFGPPPFDFERLTRFMAYGFLMSPVQFHWFAFLSRAFPITKQSGTIPALKRVAMDQLMFAPIGGSSRRKIGKGFGVKANGIQVWPASSRS